MATHGMLVCSFFIKKRFSRGTVELLPLNQPYSVTTDDGETVSFENIFHMVFSFCQKYTTLSDDEKRQKVFSIKPKSIYEFDTATYHAITFIVKSGSYGVEGDITDRRTQQVTHRMNANEASVKEFQVVVYVPKDTGDVSITKGIFVFQSIASYGVKTITVDYLKSYLSDCGLTLNTRSVSVRAFIEKLIEQGSLYKITLIKNQLSPNRTDNMLINTGREETSYIHPNLKPEWLQSILMVFQKADETGICEIPAGENYDDISIQFKLGGHPRTVRLKYLEKLSIVEDVPDEVINDKNKFALCNYMIQTADAYKQKMVFNVGEG